MKFEFSCHVCGNTVVADLDDFTEEIQTITCGCGHLHYRKLIDGELSIPLSAPVPTPSIYSSASTATTIYYGGTTAGTNDPFLRSAWLNSSAVAV